MPLPERTLGTIGTSICLFCLGFVFAACLLFLFVCVWMFVFDVCGCVTLKTLGFPQGTVRFRFQRESFGFAIGKCLCRLGLNSAFFLFKSKCNLTKQLPCICVWVWVRVFFLLLHRFYVCLLRGVRNESIAFAFVCCTERCPRGDQQGLL